MKLLEAIAAYEQESGDYKSTHSFYDWCCEKGIDVIEEIDTNLADFTDEQKANLNEMAEQILGIGFMERPDILDDILQNFEFNTPNSNYELDLEQ